MSHLVRVSLEEPHTLVPAGQETDQLSKDQFYHDGTENIADATAPRALVNAATWKLLYDAQPSPQIAAFVVRSLILYRSNNGS